jgi:aminoglycoside phosphotransferase (APT) family kinase protein
VTAVEHRGKGLPVPAVLAQGDDLRAALERRLGDVLGTAVAVRGLARLAGGASRETWTLDAVDASGCERALVLRRCRPDAHGAAMTVEARTSAAAGAVGVPVPEVLHATDDPTDLGGPYLVAARVAGETIPRRVYRLLDGGTVGAPVTAAVAAGRAGLARQCGAALARLHRVDGAVVGDATADAAVRDGAASAGGGAASPSDGDALDGLRVTVDELGLASPAFELGMRWLADHRPPPVRRALVHGDFRVGNLVVGVDGLRAVLDWELVHAGDPLEDLGWFCVRAWRFGEDTLGAGGLAPVDVLVDAYEAEAGVGVERADLAWWIALGTLRWGVMCASQAERHLSGAEPSVELAVIGRRIAENEWDLLAHLRAAGWPPP